MASRRGPPNRQYTFKAWKTDDENWPLVLSDGMHIKIPDKARRQRKRLGNLFDLGYDLGTGAIIFDLACTGSRMGSKTLLLQDFDFGTSSRFLGSSGTPGKTDAISRSLNSFCARGFSVSHDLNLAFPLILVSLYCQVTLLG